MAPNEPTNPTNPPETHRFQAEVSQVLNLVINSLYSHKEVFLRELISNASDALDKLRFRAISEPSLLAGDPSLEIRISPDRDAGTLTIEDTGVGMTHDELVQNLGTIAHSGSKAFLEALAQKGQKDVNLIGQFGVGFYSAFLVADRVEVTTRAAGTDTAYRWSSDAREGYTIEPVERAARGTSVVLHLKEDQREFLAHWGLKDLVRRYSDFVGHAIKLRAEPKAAPEPGDDAAEKPAEATPKATEPVVFETVNRASALWQRPKSEITDAQYEEFYKHLTHDHEGPLARTHFAVEGNQAFTGLLFLPRHAPMFEADTTTRRGIRLFVKRVFIMDQCDEILPAWLRFVRGVVDSDDLPLNVSRETLQDSAVVKGIRKQVVRKSLDLMEDLAKNKPEDYTAFWQAFGAVLKEALATEYEYKDRVSKLLRFASTHGEGQSSLAEYVARMPEGQPAIYYIIGESREALAGSAYLEALRKRGYEVLFLTDPVDEWAMDGLREFEGKKLVSAMRADLDLGETDESKAQHAEQEAALKPLLERVKTVLGDQVRDVRVSDRLAESPACLVIPAGGHHAYLERLLKERGRGMGNAPRTLELNPTHPLITALRALHERDAASERVTEWIETLYDQALLTEGSRPTDPNRFARRITSLLQAAAETASRA